jgi:hypothetical protein
VLKRFGSNSIVGSICPKISDTASPDYGYNPAVGAIIDRLKEALGGRCLPRKLVPDAEGEVPCKVVEAIIQPATGCPGAGEIAGRELTIEVEPELDRAVRAELRRTGVCDGSTAIDCASMCLYTIQQTSGADLAACQEGGTNVTGYCYIDPAPPPIGSGVGNPELVATCPASQKRLLRFVGDRTPRPGAVTFIACTGAAFSTSLVDQAPEP